MSKLDDIIARARHESDTYDCSEAGHAMEDRDYLIILVNDLSSALGSLLTASAGYDSCSTGQQNEYDAAAEAAHLALNKVEL